jgi:hypothetical protein
MIRTGSRKAISTEVSRLKRPEATGISGIDLETASAKFFGIRRSEG